MRAFAPRSFAARLLLVVVVFMSLPRTWFHHCDEAGAYADAHGPAAVHTDTHCAICEAPVPISDEVAPLSFVFGERLLGTFFQAAPSSRIAILVEAPRLRGPPVA